MTTNRNPSQLFSMPVYANPLQVRSPDLSFEIRTLKLADFDTPQSLIVNCYEIIWIRKGSGKFRVDMHMQEILANQIVLLSPGQHFMTTPSDVIEGFKIRFSLEFLSLNGKEVRYLFNSSKQTGANAFPFFQPDMQMHKEIELITSSLISEYSNYFISRTEALKGLLKILLIHLSRRIEYLAVPGFYGLNTELLTKFILLVDRDFIKKKKVSDYARELFVSPNYLNEIIKKGTGFSASYHVHQRIILEAKRLALNSGISMKTIAFKLGYEDAAHFSKFFRKQSGVSFSDFRKQLGILSEK